MSYRVQFTIPASGGSAAGAFLVDFCSDSPVVGQSCTPPTDMSTTAVDTSTANTTVSSVAASTVKVVPSSDYSAGDPVDVTLTKIDNPSVSGPLYARIITYDTAAHTSNYTTTALGTGAKDNGGIAAYITSDIGVNAAVRETLTFCVASATITADCGDASSHLPNLELGEGTAGAKALDASHLSTVDLYTLLSTNAGSGAVVKLRSNVSCGGLKRVGASTCDIPPADGTTVANVTQGAASFGIKADAATGTAVSGSGGTSGNLAPTNSYSTSTYRMYYKSDNTAGVTSAYGDDFLNTGGHPVNNEQLQLTLGASVSNVTPAGLYKASLNMIATGTY